MSQSRKAPQIKSKLAQLPPTYKIHKRTLAHAPGTLQTIYLSSSTPFMSAVTRLRKRINALQKLRSQSLHARCQSKGRDRILATALASLEQQSEGARFEEIVVQGSGKAVDKVLTLAGWLQERADEEGVSLRLATKSWWAIDDILVDEDGDENRDEGIEAVPESRLRRISVLELKVSVLS